MSEQKQSIVLWCSSANNQRALAVRLSDRFHLAGIVIDEKKSSAPPKSLTQIPMLIWERFRFRDIYKSWERLQIHYSSIYAEWPKVPTIRVEGINNQETEDFTTALQPQLIVVSGTGLVKGSRLNIPTELGIINLHTGLSPYVKGGPNCTNWCIANNDWHLTGNTIMWINAGIDAGNIIASEHLDISTAPNLFEAQKKIMDYAHDLYARAIDYLLNTKPPHNSVAQSSLGKGRLFLTKMWTTAKKRDLLKNWKQRNRQMKQAVPETIKLPKNYT